jgi:hypothetical protein
MKYWEAEIDGKSIKAPTLKALAVKLGIKPTLIEGIYYRKKLEDLMTIRKVVEEEKKVCDMSANFIVTFD